MAHLISLIRRTIRPIVFSKYIIANRNIRSHRRLGARIALSSGVAALAARRAPLDATLATHSGTKATPSAKGDPGGWGYPFSSAHRSERGSSKQSGAWRLMRCPVEQLAMRSTSKSLRIREKVASVSRSSRKPTKAMIREKRKRLHPWLRLSDLVSRASRVVARAAVLRFRLRPGPAVDPDRERSILTRFVVAEHERPDFRGSNANIDEHPQNIRSGCTPGAVPSHSSESDPLRPRSGRDRATRALQVQAYNSLGFAKKGPAGVGGLTPAKHI